MRRFTAEDCFGLITYSPYTEYTVREYYIVYQRFIPPIVDNFETLKVVGRLSA